MKNLKTMVCLLSLIAADSSLAADFSFERPGSGISTGITPVGRLAWEQSLANATYLEQNIDGDKAKTVTVKGDMLFRTGLTRDLELQLGWDGASWYEHKHGDFKEDNSGLGDISVALKRAIDLKDDKLSMALQAKAIIATGNDEFTVHDDIYSLASAVAYKYSDLINTSITMRYEVQNSDWAITAIPTINYKIAGKLSGYSEFVYRKAESQDYEYALGTGLIYALNRRAKLDASIGVDLDGQDKSYNGGFGFAYLF